jgi:hypothetical protein
MKADQLTAAQLYLKHMYSLSLGKAELLQTTKTTTSTHVSDNMHTALL